jgi:hypothetical protein
MLSLIRRKACKRCGGDLSIECDIYGVSIECIQCGASYNKEDLAQMTPEAPKTNANAAVKAAPVPSTRPTR